MGRLTLANPRSHSPASPDAADGHTAVLAEIYGQPVPATALLLDDYLRSGRIPLRDPGDRESVVDVDLPVAASVFGCDLDTAHHHLHRLHATGALTLDGHGAVELRDLTG